MIRKSVCGVFRSVLNRVQYRIGEEYTAMRQVNFKWTDEQKKILFKDNNHRKKLYGSYHDFLVMPGYDKARYQELYYEFMMKEDATLSPEFIALLMYQFTMHKQMTPSCFDKLETYVYRHRGEFKLRSIYGALCASLAHHRPKLVEFFMQEYYTMENRFTLSEVLFIVEALNQNKVLSKEEKREFWEEHFKKHFMDGIVLAKTRQIRFILQMFDIFHELEDFDENLWKEIIRMLRNKRGWARIPIIEKLYSVTGTFDFAKELFDEYYNQLAKNNNVLARYNLGELRYYTPKQLIEHARSDESFSPTHRTIVPKDQNADEWNEKLREWKKIGSVKEEAEVIKDKSQSLAYAIKARYEQMKQDNADLSKLSKAEFVELFGGYDEALLSPETADAEGEALEEGEEGGEEEYNDEDVEDSIDLEHPPEQS